MPAAAVPTGPSSCGAGASPAESLPPAGSAPSSSADRRESADASGQPPGRGYSATRPQLLGRLARIEGQVRGIAKMVDDDRYCIDVLTQISAARAALDKVALGLLDQHARHCLFGPGGGPTEPDEQVAELMGAIGRMLAR